MKRFLAAIALISLAGCGGSYSNPVTPTSPTPAPPPAAAADVTIHISGMAGANSFSPANATIKVGQTVAWKNDDSIAHAIAQDGGGFNTATISPGATSGSQMISAAGAIPYHCSIHPSMTGTLTATQ